jgi:hypothetical protein
MSIQEEGAPGGRAETAHLAPKDIEELGQAFDRRIAQKSANRSEAAELAAIEGGPESEGDVEVSPDHAFALHENRAGATALDRKRDEKHQGKASEQDESRGNDLSGSLCWMPGQLSLRNHLQLPRRSTLGRRRWFLSATVITAHSDAFLSTPWECYRSETESLSKQFVLNLVHKFN